MVERTKATELRVTQFGFVFGPAEVQRWTEHRGYVSLAIVTAKQQLEIVVTPSGLIRAGTPIRAASASAPAEGEVGDG